ncbi:hypothetical protein MNBD_GAMMA06-308 [hydrothermal vent metagenome]|uniref:PEP-CTERM protein-sorting domain-containing protein n=1 Tax=hydrothermal vent metagenome TaxID=652676 RepID=A0A3B0WGF4_9ZZZZ
MRKTTKLAVGVALALAASGAANATVYDITAVLSGNDGGFSYSSLNDASGSNSQGLGPDGELASILDAGSLGTYDDVTGAFDAVLALDNVAGPITLAGTLFFDNAGLLSANSTLGITFSGTQSGSLSDTVLGFVAGDICCSGTNDPNSFDGNFLTLWGANFSDASFGGSYTGATLGMDLRIELTSVPVPAAVWLFGSGLLGLVGVVRRKKA